MPTRAVATAIAVLLAISVLVVVDRSGGGGGDREAGSLEPAFEPLPDDDQGTSTTPSTAAAGPGATVAPPPAGGSTAPPVTDPGGAPAPTVPVTEASVTDPAGDATPSPIDPPPEWADLLGARLIRSGAGFELRIRLAGGDAPEHAPDDGHTMNLASFYDVDGDGVIDYEVWANIATGGWGASYFDNDRGSGAFLEESHVEVTTEGDEVVLRFSLLHLDGAERFRWSIASEWGRYEAIGTPAMVRDEVPDDDAAADFPQS